MLAWLASCTSKIKGNRLRLSWFLSSVREISHPFMSNNQSWEKGWAGGTSALGAMVYFRGGGALTLTLREGMRHSLASFNWALGDLVPALPTTVKQEREWGQWHKQKFVYVAFGKFPPFLSSKRTGSTNSLLYPKQLKKVLAYHTLLTQFAKHHWLSYWISMLTDSLC